MSSVGADSSLATGPSPDDPLDGVWETYLHAAKVDGETSKDSTANMNSILTFAGLFAATVAAFVIESYKALSPDTGQQAVALLAQLVASGTNITTVSALGDVTQAPFHAPQWAVLVNTLWFLALVISLLCALLATLSQEWGRDFLRVQSPVFGATLEEHARRVLGFHMGVSRYGVDRIPTLVVSLMHSAVILFLIGLNVFIFPLHDTPALAVASVTGAAALLYVVASATPLTDRTSPYSTPLTHVYTAFIVIPLTVMSCLLGYCVFVVFIVRDWVRHGALDHDMVTLLDPRLAMTFLWDPLLATRLTRAFVAHFIQPNYQGLQLIEKLLMVAVGDDVRPATTFLNDKEFKFLWKIVGAYALKRARFMQYLINHVVDAAGKDSGRVFVRLRRDKEAVADIAAQLCSAESASEAVAVLRLFQLLLTSQTPRDEFTQALTSQNHRWRCLNPIVEAFETFAQRLAHINDSALEEADPSVIQAVSWFRWAILLLLRRVPEGADESLARTQCTYILRQLNGSLRLLPLSSNDPDPAVDLSVVTNDRLLELASRNVFTLLEGLRQCEWKSDQEKPDDSRFLNPKLGPSIWRWLDVFGEIVGHTKLPASAEFREFLLLTDERLRPWMQSNSSWDFPDDLEAGPVVGLALRDLATVVDPRDPGSNTSPSKRAGEGTVSNGGSVVLGSGGDWRSH